jgi:hypothetical protein
VDDSRRAARSRWEGGQKAEEERALMDWVMHGLKGDLFPGLA